MKSKLEMPSKYDVMKVLSHNFIRNEKVNTELEHEFNAGKIDSNFYSSQSKVIKEKESASPAIKTSSHLTEASPTNRTYTSVLPEPPPALTPTRYTSTCYFRNKLVPHWCSESLIMDLNSTRKVHDVTVYFKNVLQPVQWADNFTTEVKPANKIYKSELTINIEDDSNIHYISLEPQQFSSLIAEIGRAHV